MTKFNWQYLSSKRSIVWIDFNLQKIVWSTEWTEHGAPKSIEYGTMRDLRYDDELNVHVYDVADREQYYLDLEPSFQRQLKRAYREWLDEQVEKEVFGE